MKKPVFCSHDQIRLYLEDGWDEAEVRSLFETGQPYIPHPEDVCPYFALDRQKESKFDIGKLIDRTSVVYRGFDLKSHLSDVEFLKLINH